jgi:hypothetical protein
MAGEYGEAGQQGPSEIWLVWRSFRRARMALWALLLLLVLLGAALHDWTTRSPWARMLWITAAAAAIGYPLRYLLGFRCPRCGGVYLATGGLRDFLGVHRVLWARRCGTCSLRAGHPDTSAEFPDSRPGAAF